MLTPTHPCPSLRLLRKPFLSPGPLTSLPVFIRRPACHLLANRSSDFTLHRENEGQGAGDQSPQGIEGWLCQIADTFNSAPQAVHLIDQCSTQRSTGDPRVQRLCGVPQLSLGPRGRSSRDPRSLRPLYGHFRDKETGAQNSPQTMGRGNPAKFLCHPAPLETPEHKDPKSECHQHFIDNVEPAVGISSWISPSQDHEGQGVADEQSGPEPCLCS